MIDIIFEDKDIIAINKPAGLAVHSDGRQSEKTLADFLLEKYPEMKQVGEPMEVKSYKVHKVESENIETQDTELPNTNYQLITIPRPGIVHRLDRGTSGVMLIAKNQESFLFLKEQFQNHTIQKVYQAFVYGWPTKDEGVIDEPIGRSGKDFRQWTASRTARGVLRDAITEYKTLFRGSDEPITLDEKVSDAHRYSIMELYPKTGRTHQLRVHLKYINHPIVADALYATNRPCVFGFSRPALHARQITFTTKKGERKTIVAPYPTDFSSAFKEIGYTERK